MLNHTGQWRLGSRQMFDLIPRSLVTRLKQERLKQWAPQHRAAVTAATKALSDCKAAHGDAKGALPDDVQRAREELEARLLLLQEGGPEKEGVDPGPLLEVVAWHDGAVWRVAVDTSDIYIKPEDRCGIFLLMQVMQRARP